MFESIGDRYHMYMVKIMFRWDQGTDFKMTLRDGVRIQNMPDADQNSGPRPFLLALEKAHSISEMYLKD